VQGISVFMPIILNDNGWTATKAQLYSVPPYVCACLVAICIAFVSDKTKMRGIYLAGFKFLGITGFSILRWNHDPNVRYAAIYLLTIGTFPGGPGFWSWAVNSKNILLYFHPSADICPQTRLAQQSALSLQAGLYLLVRWEVF
jgi:hypothetical protein